MPMLTTLRIGLPVWPRHSPERTRSQKAAIRSSVSCTSLTTSTPSTTQRAVARHPQRHVQHGAVLGDVDVLAGEHRFAALGDAALAGQLAEQQQRLVGDPVLGEVEVEAGALGDQALAALGVGGEEVAQVGAADLLVVGLQRAPRRAARAAAPASLTRPRPRAGRRSTSSSSSQDLLKLSLPSSWRRAASAATSIPAVLELRQHLLGVAAVGRASGRRPRRGRRRPCRVGSGIVLTVKGEAKASM